MATTEHTGLMTYIDENGNHYILYPVTNIDAVDGLLEELNNKVPKSNVVNNFTTTEEGFVADARALKVLNDSKLSMELRWKNASPFSEFPAQNVDVDLSGGKFALIGCKPTHGNPSTVAWAIAEIGKSIEFSRSLPVDNHYKYTIASRDIGVYPTYVSFGNGKEVTAPNNPAENPTWLVPLEIYIIKGVSA